MSFSNELNTQETAYFKCGCHVTQNTSANSQYSTFIRVVGKIMTIFLQISFVFLIWIFATLFTQVNGLPKYQVINISSYSTYTVISIILALFLSLLMTLFANMIIGFGISRTKDKKSYDFHAFSEAKKRNLLELMSGSLKIQTVSYDSSGTTSQKTDYSEFEKIHQYIIEAFPLIHAEESCIKRTIVNQFSLLYEWPGNDSSLSPVMLCAHLDVVPASNETLHQWKHPPFSGYIDTNDVVWGRGAIDNKHNVFMQMQAIEDMLTVGVKAPARTIFLAYGHDEEIGGCDGARNIAKEMTLRLEGQKLLFILDEGPFVIKNLIPGISNPIGLIANREKGCINVELKVNTYDPGHSSLPDTETNLGILSTAINRLEKNLLPPYTDKAVNDIRGLGLRLPFLIKIVVFNMWLFRPLLTLTMSRVKVLSAFIRTTTAITVSNYGEKINIINAEAKALVNHRIHPEDQDGDTVVAYDKKIVNDSRVQIKKYLGGAYIKPSPVSPIDCPEYKYIANTLESVTGCFAMSNLLVGNTDTRWYWDLSKHIYRQTPVVFENMADTSMFHGLNERINSEQLAIMLHFYITLIQGLDKVI